MDQVNILDSRVESFQGLNIVFRKFLPFESKLGGYDLREAFPWTDFIGYVEDIRYDRNGYVAETCIWRAFFGLRLF